MTSLLASIPSPSSPFIFHLGPFSPRWYGTLLAIGVVLGSYIVARELARRGRDADLTYAVAAWTVPGGVIGARLYHVVTDWDRFSGHYERIPKLWEGGLGLPGVIAGGALGAYIGARRAGVPPLVMFDCIAPGLVIAQALGRFGNYFNQELFGGPTSLPWGLEIDAAQRPPGYIDNATFHPTFLYESLWDLGVACVLFVLIRRFWRRLPAGTIFLAYLALYGIGRTWVEGLRVDQAQMLGPVRFNQALFAVVAILAAAVAVPRILRAVRQSDPPAAERPLSPRAEARRAGPRSRPPGTPS
jgi:prolipoprotein diacylglyceryl transferase